MVDEVEAIPGGEHVDEDTSGGGAITEVGIRKSLVSGRSVVEDVVETVDIVGCMPTSAAPRSEVNVPKNLYRKGSAITV
jgi:hypothetical protein